MKPPNLAGLLKRFDCSAIDPVQVRRHLGYELDERTGLRVSLGYATAEDLTAPYAFVPVSGDEAREVRELGDRFRDPRWLWCRADLSPGRDDDHPDGEMGADLVVRSNGEIYEVIVRQDVQALTDFRGYLLARRAT